MGGADPPSPPPISNMGGSGPPKPPSIKILGGVGPPQNPKLGAYAASNNCLMSSQSQELYIAILDRIFSNLPNFKPMTVALHWESAPRNSFKEIYPNIKINGCWFHYTQRIWAKVQKLELTQSFHENSEITKFVKQLMTIPFYLQV